MICYHSTFPKSQHLRKGTRPMFDQELPVSYYEEISQLLDYVQNEQDSIYDVAKKINPMKSFLGEIK